MKLFTVVIVLYGAVFAADWSYDNQTAWPGLCNSGTKQSPINIQTASAEEIDLEPFAFSGYFEDFFANVTNTGHTVKIVLLDTKEVPTVEEGGLPGTYALDSVHFHWNSEHTINGYRYPAELHAVHYNVQYGNIDNATLYENGLAVFSILFEISSDDDKYFTPIMKVIDDVDSIVGMTAQTNKSFSPDIFFPRDTSEYYRYTGSLTTPDCNEGVIWTIFTNTLHISKSQISYFTNVWSETGLLTENYRDLQALNGRTVYEKY